MTLPGLLRAVKSPGGYSIHSVSVLGFEKNESAPVDTENEFRFYFSFCSRFISFVSLKVSRSCVVFIFPRNLFQN